MRRVFLALIICVNGAAVTNYGNEINTQVKKEIILVDPGGTVCQVRHGR